MDDFDTAEPLYDQEVDVIEIYRNWPIYETIGGEFYVTIDGHEKDCTTIQGARQEIDKSIKRWSAEQRRKGLR